MNEMCIAIQLKLLFINGIHNTIFRPGKTDQTILDNFIDVYEWSKWVNGIGQCIVEPSTRHNNNGECDGYSYMKK